MAIRKVVSRSIGTDVIVAEDLAANSITVSELSDNAVTNAKLHQDVHRGSRKNLIINGAMQVAQRGTSKTGITSGAKYTSVDRIEFNSDFPAGVTSVATSQDTDAPAGFSNSFKIQSEQARSGALSGADRMFINYKVEAQDLQHLQYGTSDAKTLTFSFWIKSNLTGVVSIEVSNPDTPDSNYQNYHEEVTINSADTWEYKTVSISGNQNGGIDNNNDTGLNFTITASAGPTFTGGTWTTGVWQDTTAGNRASPSNIDLYSSTSNYVKITGLQLEVGDTATHFEHRSYAEDLTLCMRYYQRHDHRYYFRVRNDSRGSQNPDWAIPITYPHPMRIVPTVNTFTDSNFTTSGYTSTGGSDMQMQIDKWGMYVTGNSNTSGAGAVGALWWMELVAEL